MSRGGASGRRDYLRHLRDTRTELGILGACALLVLVLADPLLIAVLDALAFDPVLRRCIVALPPALALVLGVL